MEALLRISQDMARVLDKLTTPKAPIDMVRRHGAEEFYGTSMEESDKAEYWLEKLQRVFGLLEIIQKKKSKDHVPEFGFGLRVGSGRVRWHGPSHDPGSRVYLVQ